MHTQNTRTNIQAKKYKIYVKNQFSSANKELIKISVYTWITVIELKNLIQKLTKIPKDLMRLFYKTMELTHNNAQLDSYGIKNGITLSLYETKDYRESKGDLRPYDIFSRKGQTDKQKYDLEKLEASYSAIESGFFYQIKPQLTDEGTSGSYFLLDKDKKKIAIFKPMDEEAYAPNNPRGYVGELGSTGFRKGILSGESANREVAAYILDYYTSGGRHRVPITTYIEFYHPSFDLNTDYTYTTTDFKKNTQISPSTSTTKSSIGTTKNESKRIFTKHGSLQLFKYHEGVVGDFGDSLYPVEDVHSIGILDIRVLNCDRNEENILIQKVEKFRDRPAVLKNLIPIDHGLSLPSSFEILEDEIQWMYWSASKKPFSKDHLDFIASIDIDSQMELLRKKLKIREICLRNFKIANMILKKYAAKGYTLYQIGQIIYREDEEEQSPVEKVVEWAETMYKIKKKIGYHNKMHNLMKKQHIHKIKVDETLDMLKKMTSAEYQPENHNNQHQNIKYKNFEFDDSDGDHPEKIVEDPSEEDEEEQDNNNIKDIKISNNNLTKKPSLNDMKLEQQQQNGKSKKNSILDLQANNEPKSPKQNGSNLHILSNSNLINSEKKSNLNINNEEENINQEKKNSVKKFKGLKKCASLPNLDSLNDKKSKSGSSEDEEDEKQNLQLNHQISENNGKFSKMKGTKSSYVNRLNWPSLNDEQEVEVWDEVFYECIENALDIVIGCKNQDPPKAPHFGPMLNLIKQQSSNSRSRFMSHDLNNLEDDL